MPIRKLSIVVLAALSMRCAEYANVYVSVKDPAGGAVPRVRIYSGRSGEFLDLNSVKMPLRKLRFSAAPTLSLIVRNDCRIVGWQVVQVEKWAATPADSMNATNKNEVLFIVDPKEATCP